MKKHEIWSSCIPKGSPHCKRVVLPNTVDEHYIEASMIGLKPRKQTLAVLVITKTTWAEGVARDWEVANPRSIRVVEACYFDGAPQPLMNACQSGQPFNWPPPFRVDRRDHVKNAETHERTLDARHCSRVSSKSVLNHLWRWREHSVASYGRTDILAEGCIELVGFCPRNLPQLGWSRGALQGKVGLTSLSRGHAPLGCDRPSLSFRSEVQRQPKIPFFLLVAPRIAQASEPFLS